MKRNNGDYKTANKVTNVKCSSTRLLPKTPIQIFDRSRYIFYYTLVPGGIKKCILL